MRDEKEKFEDWVVYYEMANRPTEEAKSMAALATANEEGHGDAAGIICRAREVACGMGLALDESLHFGRVDANQD